ncbi:hypothetical protein P691DRAFT_509394 [Macrolepiota fuliginosa MF-IS2]|uniref:Nephrocystin 3-like N-terminal domain-containing protein n=1 Tax=Macrolepiota fuliginosa MF-IS2 TaxID=1400762 RepID=A0A9P5X3A1_9AGAR|nr:hypothetical protein P691DRAFT_509394 [Macrolepiota fuliginosa MF-IS2]
MPYFQGSSNFKAKHNTFVDANIINHNETYTERQYRGIDMLLKATTPQALYDSSECNKPGCFEGTREEHIRNITGWGRGDWKAYQARVLWLEGPAGVGKSAVAQTCAQGMENKLGATFFFSRPNGWNKPATFLPTIAYQLTTKYPAYRDLVDAIVLHDPLILEKSIQVQFRKLLAQPLRQLEGVEGGVDDDIVIIVDGLDECDGKDAQSTIIRVITSSVHQQSTPFLWAFFSRPEPHIRSAFSTEQAIEVCWQLTLPVSRDADRDIEAYLRDGFKTIRAKYNVPAAFPWPSEGDIHRLVEQSAGLFAYTASAIRYVDGPGISGPEERLRSVLGLGMAGIRDNPLANLDRFYLLIMKEIPEETLPNAIQLLSILGSIGPLLSGSVICVILKLSLTAFYAAVNNLYSVLKIEKTEDGMPGRLSFYHASFGDFLSDKKRSTQKFYVDRDDVLDRLDHLCIEALCGASNAANDKKFNVLSWSGPRNSVVCRATFFYLVYCTSGRGGHLWTGSLRHLSRVNWNVVGQDVTPKWKIEYIEALVQKIPERWRPHIIYSSKPSLLSILRQKGFGEKLASLMQALKKGRYVIGTGSNRALLVEEWMWKSRDEDSSRQFCFRTYPDAAEFKRITE